MEKEQEIRGLRKGNYSSTEEIAFIETVPVFINVRDRLSCLQRLLTWLERAGHRNIMLIDNASTYPPLLRFLETSGYRTIRLKRNLGHTALWRVKELRNTISEQWFVYSDPDVIPAEACPHDVVARMKSLLLEYPFYVKAGLGLRLEDIPDSYHLKQQVIDWEPRQLGLEIAPDVCEADVDTTFALYRPGTPYILGPAIRLQGKFSARHLPWYSDSNHPDEEEQYYRNHASPSVTTWNTNGDVRDQGLAISGGIAGHIRRDPHGALRKAQRSMPGRIGSLLAVLRHPWKNIRPEPLSREPLTVEQTWAAIVDIITSKEWSMAWRLTEPFRRLKYRSLAFFR